MNYPARLRILNNIMTLPSQHAKVEEDKMHDKCKQNRNARINNLETLYYCKYKNGFIFLYARLVSILI